MGKSLVPKYTDLKQSKRVARLHPYQSSMSLLDIAIRI